jgi:hypothetical protein
VHRPDEIVVASDLAGAEDSVRGAVRAAALDIPVETLQIEAI